MTSFVEILEFLKVFEGIVCTGLVVYMVVRLWPAKDKDARDEREKMADKAVAEREKLAQENAADRREFSETLVMIVKEHREIANEQRAGMHEIAEVVDRLKDALLKGEGCNHGKFGG